MSLEKITQQEIYDASMERLANYPTAASRYGIGGLNDRQLKARYDKLAKLAIAKLNVLIDSINSPAESADALLKLLITPIPGKTEDEYLTLCDVLEDVISGDLATYLALEGLAKGNLQAELEELERLISDTTSDFGDAEKAALAANTEARHSHLNKSVLDSTTAPYTAEEKDKLNTIEKGAQVNPEIIDNLTSVSADNPLSANQGRLLNEKVDGKQPAGDYATLVDGKIPSSQLPSYVDDVIEKPSRAEFPEPGESGKIYVAQDTNITYRWSGTGYVEISESLALGETAGTAFRGDHGKLAYEHSQSSGNPHGTTAEDIGIFIEQTTGNSENAVMSQKATTVEINALKSDIIDLQTALDIPDYVKAEAEATIEKSFSHGNLGRTIRFIAVSDAHNDVNKTGSYSEDVLNGNKHCGQAVKYIADRIGLDFIAFLGDATWAGTAQTADTYNQTMLMNDIFSFNDFIADGYKGIPNIRLVGNHDQLYTTKDTSARLWNSGAYNIFGRYCNGLKNIPAGYGYLDFESTKVRVIYLNTSDIPSATTAGTYLGMTQEQLNWLAETLLEVGDKADWKILILSHAPLDLIKKSDVLTAYVDGTMYGSYDFANHNSAKLLANVHGHVHCYSYGYVEDKIRRFCIPNSNFQDNNHYKNNASYAQWSDTVTYPKTANTGKDTAFSLVTIDLDTNVCYVDNYGAGIDREFSCDYYTPPAPTVLLNLGRDYVAGTTDESVANNLDESKAYTNVSYGNLMFYTSACTYSDVSENSVTVKESGSGGICIAYPVRLPDLATQDYVLSFDYSGAGKLRAYYRLSTDAGSFGPSHAIIDDTAGASGTKSETISAGGEAYTWLIVLFSSNTGNTKSYTNVKLEKVT